MATKQNFNQRAALIIPIINLALIVYSRTRGYGVYSSITEYNLLGTDFNQLIDFLPILLALFSNYAILCAIETLKLIYCTLPINVCSICNLKIQALTVSTTSQNQLHFLQTARAILPFI